MFTQEQISSLSVNENVARCGLKYIAYKREFKIWAMKKYFEQGCSPNEIFSEAGFDLSVIGKYRPEQNMKLWRQAYNSKGEKAFLKENHKKRKGRKKRPDFKNDKEKIKYLEAKIAYMDAENDFLAKLRGLKRE